MDYHDLNEGIHAIVLNLETIALQIVREKKTNYWKPLYWNFIDKKQAVRFVFFLRILDILHTL